MFLCGEVKEEREIKRKRKRKRRETKKWRIILVLRFTTSRIKMTPKKKKCIVLFVPGAKWNQKDRKEWNWNWNGSSFILPHHATRKLFCRAQKTKIVFVFLPLFSLVVYFSLLV